MLWYSGRNDLLGTCRSGTDSHCVSLVLLSSGGAGVSLLLENFRFVWRWFRRFSFNTVLSEVPINMLNF
jgi:hypothetical protein